MDAAHFRHFIAQSLAAAVVAMGGPALCDESKSSEPPSSAIERASDREPDRAEMVTFNHEGRQRTMTGRVIAQAADGGILLQGDDAVLWMIQRDELVRRSVLDTPFEPLSPNEMADRLLAELPPSFRVYHTPHYVVCYNTSRAYAQWTASLLERLHKAFTNYWNNQGLDLHEPEFPLPIIVFADAQSYDKASRDDLPSGTGVLAGNGGIVGYYSLRSNRVNMYDLTGVEALRDERNRRGSLREINQMLSQPEAVPLVATIVHEATHQIAFNCGLSARYADIPLWLCEGMAVYFEAPDLSSSRGWRGIGKVNHARLTRFLDNLPNWQDDSLARLIASDELFRNPQTAVDAYADAWALNYYLIRFRGEDYAAYLKMLAKKRPLMEDDAAMRLAEFRNHFGDPHRLQQDFLRQMPRVK